MKWLLRLVLILSVGFTGLWAVARNQILKAAERFVAEQAALGGGGGVTAGWSPAELKLTLHDLVLVDPASGSTLAGPVVQLSAPSYQPWRLGVRVHSAILQSAQTITWTAGDAEARFVITPGLDLALQEVAIDGIEWQLASDQGWSFAAGRIAMSLTRSPQLLSQSPSSSRTLALAENGHDLDLRIADLALDPAWTQALVPSGLPAVLKSLSVDAVLSFEAPLDRHLDARGPQLTAVELTGAKLIWGKASLTASGRLVTGAEGLAEGDITLDITRPADLLAGAEVMGFLTQDQAGFLQKGLTAYADPERSDVVKITLKLADGLVKLGPFPLGPAPRLTAS